MSNSLAIAAVTAALQQVLQQPVKDAINSATVGFSRPDGAAAGQQSPLVNIYLYQATPNAAFRNADLPTRRDDSTLVRRPQAALDLHYLFTFHGDDTKLEPQLLLGAVTLALHSQPLLSKQNVAAAVKQFAFLAGSGIDQQVERVKFTPTSLSLEEFSKLWSVFFQVEYSLSAAYQASVVLIESDDVPQSAPQVAKRNVYAIPFRWPQVDRIVPLSGPTDPIVPGSTLLIQGTQLRGDTTLIVIDGQEFTPTVITDTQLTLPLPVTLRAGVKGLQVVQKLAMGFNDLLHRGFESNVAAFVLRPHVSAASAVAAPSPPGGADVTLTLQPDIAAGQRAVLLLNDVTAVPPTAFASKPVIAPATANNITIRIAGVPAGAYLVRVQVDGAESLLDWDKITSKFTGPPVTMP
jgi:hypothetical protein